MESCSRFKLRRTDTTLDLSSMSREAIAIRVSDSFYRQRGLQQLPQPKNLCFYFFLIFSLDFFCAASPWLPQHATPLGYRTIKPVKVTKQLRVTLRGSSSGRSWRDARLPLNVAVTAYFWQNFNLLLFLSGKNPIISGFGSISAQRHRFHYQIWILGKFRGPFWPFLAMPGNYFQNLCHSNLHSYVISEVSSQMTSDSENRLNCYSGDVGKSSVR